MRDIKSRAWLKEEKIMIDVSEINFHGEVVSGFDESDVFYEGYGYDYVELMQYTGLCDKNGKEIYEGDIVRTADGSMVATIKIGECYPEPVKYCCELCGIKKHTVHCLHAYDKDGEYLIEDNKSLEIIGDMFGNPELLEENNENNND